MRLPGARALPVEADTRLRRRCVSSTELLALPESVNREPPRPPQEMAHLIREPVRKSGALTARISTQMTRTSVGRGAAMIGPHPAPPRGPPPAHRRGRCRPRPRSRRASTHGAAPDPRLRDGHSRAAGRVPVNLPGNPAPAGGWLLLCSCEWARGSERPGKRPESLHLFGRTWPDARRPSGGGVNRSYAPALRAQAGRSHRR
jgi:hypothetical protein